jgi:hypothetical protein
VPTPAYKVRAFASFGVRAGCMVAVAEPPPLRPSNRSREQMEKAKDFERRAFEHLFNYLNARAWARTKKDPVEEESNENH